MLNNGSIHDIYNLEQAHWFKQNMQSNKIQKT